MSPARELRSARGSYARRVRLEARAYPMLARHSLRRSSSERTCVSIMSCNACVPLLDNSADAFLSKFWRQSRIARWRLSESLSAPTPDAPEVF
jgi:hypothetical protein